MGAKSSTRFMARVLDLCLLAPLLGLVPLALLLVVAALLVVLLIQVILSRRRTPTSPIS